MINKLYIKIRNWFIYGIIIVLPIAVSVWVVITLINVVSIPLNLLSKEKFSIFFTFFMSLVSLTIIGLFGKNFIGRTLFKPIEILMSRMPLVNIIYKSTKQIVSSFAVQDKKNLKPVLIEYPRNGLYAIGFVTNSNVEGLKNIKGKDLGKNKIPVLIPTTPNPTSGFFVYVNKNDVEYLDMSVEDSIRVLMSAGVVSPHN